MSRPMPSPPQSPTIRVAIVEDDAQLRAGLVQQLERAPDIRCIAALPDAEQALIQLPEIVPEVVLMDINLPGKSGIDCVRLLKARLPRVQFLMLTVYEDADLIFRSLQAGATGYLLKRSVPDDLLAAIRDLHAGGAPMSPLIARKVVESFTPRVAPGPPMNLSPREREIVEALSQGDSYKEIADRLGISITTVRTHLQRIYEKLQVNNRTEAVVRFLGR